MIEATDRDLQILKKALALAITALDGVTDRQRTPASDRADMAAMLDRLCPDEFEFEMVVRNAGWVLNGTDPLPPEQMRQLRALGDDPESSSGDEPAEN